MKDFDFLWKVRSKGKTWQRREPLGGRAFRFEVTNSKQNTAKAWALGVAS
ncbi:hypothetical protein IO361_000246 [Campylobacter upsaliensis]|nr:hypothetical protein [Campylobacter upsaliensis]